MNDCMDVIDVFYKKARSGEFVDKADILGYCASFDNVILWGAGNLGSAVGNYLLQNNIHISEYWDKNFEIIKSRNTIPVRKPFNSIYDKNRTLLIPCIVNGSLGDEWTKNIAQSKGYIHIIKGMELFEGLICPFNINSAFDIEFCTQQKACSLCNCKRYVNILKNQYTNTSRNSLIFQLITFIISTKCSLKCKYCGQFITKYPANERKNFELSNIIRDIHNFMSAVDFIGMVSIIGGEPFLHKDIANIVNEFLTYKKLGVVNITTNGICDINPDTLKKIINPRVKISFSVYKTYLNERQKALLDRNIEIVAKSGINYSLSEPVWSIPGEVTNSFIRDVESATLRKKSCSNKIMAASVRNGFFIPCTTVEVGTGLKIFGTEDCVDITKKDKLRERMKAELEKNYFDACMRCRDGSVETIIAGEQL